MSKQLTDAKRRAIKKYDATTTKQIHLKLNIKTDADILEKLDKVDSIQGYIKELIRKDMGEKPQIVRCKDCNNGVIYCENGDIICDHIDSSGNDTHPADWFCADGERK